MAMSLSIPSMPAPVARWLADRSRTERHIVIGVAILIAVALFYVGLWQPLTRDRDTLRATRSARAAALVAGRAMSGEIAGLARTPAATDAPDARSSLERVLSQQNLRSAVTQLDWQEGRARLVFAAVPYDALITMLEALQRQAQLRAMEATITSRVETGTVRAELTVAR